MDKQIIILAAGHGSRMKAEIPKVMHEVAGLPMLEHVVRNCCLVSDDLTLVYSDHLEPYLPDFKDRCKLVRQEEQLGTAHAVYVAIGEFNPNKAIAVIYGDNPLITSEIINNLFDHLDKTNSKAVTLAFEYDKPNQYGRIVTDADGGFLRIVESKFANAEEIKITLCNSGVMAFAPGILEQYIDQCLVSAPKEQGKELYLTEIIEICAAAGEKVSYLKEANHKLVLGVNTQAELKAANIIVEKSD